MVVSAVNLTVLGLDGLPRAGLPVVRILLARRVVGDDDTLDEHGEWRLGVVSQAASPLDGAWGVVGVTAGPAAHHDVHGRLRVALAGVVGQSSDRDAVQVEHGLVHGPVDGVVVEGLLWRCRRVERTTVIGGGVTLGEVVGLELSGVTADPLQVDLVQVVTLQVE